MTLDLAREINCCLRCILERNILLVKTTKSLVIQPFFGCFDQTILAARKFTIHANKTFYSILYHKLSRTISHHSMFFFDGGWLAFILQNNVTIKIPVTTAMLVCPFNR